jgi:hypothetical protein
MGIALAAPLLHGCASAPPVAPIAAAAKQPLQRCTSDADCRVPTFVGSGPGGACWVQMHVDTVTVARGVHPFVVWELQKADPHDGDEVRFVQAGGVRIVGNDRARDFDLPGYRNGNERTFVWRSRNERAVSLDYTVAVQRRAPNDYGWTDCALLDPKIVNEGP